MPGAGLDTTNATASQLSLRPCPADGAPALWRPALRKRSFYKTWAETEAEAQHSFVEDFGTTFELRKASLPKETVLNLRAHIRS